MKTKTVYVVQYQVLQFSPVWCDEKQSETLDGLPELRDRLNAEQSNNSFMPVKYRIIKRTEEVIE